MQGLSVDNEPIRVTDKKELQSIWERLPLTESQRFELWMFCASDEQLRELKSLEREKTVKVALGMKDMISLPRFQHIMKTLDIDLNQQKIPSFWPSKKVKSKKD